MAKSKAQKKRLHDIRNGKRDVSLSRGTSPDYSTHERKLPTMVERKLKNMKKQDRQLSQKYRAS